MKLQDRYELGCPLEPPMYVFEDPEPSGEAGQDLMMELDYQNLHVHIETCVCGGGGGGCVPANGVSVCALNNS